MEAHEKVHRTLKVLKLLSSNIGYSLSDLSERINVSERTIKRYIKTFRDAGFFIEIRNGYYKLEKNNNFFKDIKDLLHFSKEEACILNEAINSIEASNLIKQNLKEKLFALYNSERINYPIFKQEEAGKIKKINDAIKKNKKIKLIKYNSSNSGLIKDRIVEPHNFTTNYTHLWALECEFHENYLFRISRTKISEQNSCLKSIV